MENKKTVHIKTSTRPNGTKRISWESTMKSKTDPSFAGESDINNIMKKFRKTGIVTHVAKDRGFYSENGTLPDLLTALTTVNESTSKFMELPSDIRKRFANDPVELIKFLDNPNNVEEAVKLGLMEVKLPEPSLADHVFEGLQRHETKSKKSEQKKD